MDDVLGRDPDRRVRVGRVLGGLGHGQGELEVVLEDLLDLGLVVRELEAVEAVVVLPGGELDRVRGDPGLGVRPVRVLTVGDVQVGAHARVVALVDDRVVDRRVVVGPGQGDEDLVVEALGAELPAPRVQDQVAVAVVGDREREVVAADEVLDCAGLRLRRRGRAAIGLVTRLRAGALVVESPVAVEVAVEVDAVVAGDLAVAVVVPQVLPPQAVLVEGVLVAVRVDDRDHPDLTGVEQLGRPRVVAVPVEEPLDQPHRHLGRDPLPRVGGRVVQHLGLVVPHALVGQTQGEDRTTLQARADPFELRQRRVGGVQPLQLRLDSLARVVEVVVDREAVVAGLAGPVVAGWCRELEPRLLQILAVGGRGHQVDPVGGHLEPALPGRRALLVDSGDVQAHRSELGDLPGTPRLHEGHLQLGWRCRRWHRDRDGRNQGQDQDRNSDAAHGVSLRCPPQQFGRHEDPVDPVPHGPVTGRVI